MVFEQQYRKIYQIYESVSSSLGEILTKELGFMESARSVRLA